jgi:hypothetical protein
MQEAKTSVEFRGYCTQCKRGFFLPRGPVIECDMGHQLAKNFPYDSFWNYCCGCDAFYPSNALEGKEAESNCPCCDRRINRRFFCNSCNVITVEAGDAESRRRPVEFSEDGCPFPSCPGCLLPECTAHFVLAGERLRLGARAKAPFEDLKFHWTTTPSPSPSPVQAKANDDH